MGLRDWIFGNKKKDLAKSIEKFLNASNVSDAQLILEQHPELLSEEADLMLDSLSKDIQDEKAIEVIQSCRALLAWCREEGVSQVFKEISSTSNETFGEEIQMMFEEILNLSSPHDVPRKLETIQHALSLVQRQSSPEIWGVLQSEYGSALLRSSQGHRGNDIEQAIYHYNQALEVFTQKDFPDLWAETQNNLAATYNNRIFGNQAENIEQAIEHCNQALKVHTPQDFPVQWATTQNNLANAYWNRVKGNRDENIEKSIECYNQTLRVKTQDSFPMDWAMTQNSLANTYWERIKGNRVENIKKVVYHYNQALKVLTYQNLPALWAEILYNLATAYKDLNKEIQTDDLDQVTDYHEMLNLMTFLNQIFRNKNENLLEIIKEFLGSSNTTETFRLIKQHPELLSEETDSILNSCSKCIQSEEIVDMIQSHRDLLALCREVGVSQVYEEISDSSNETFGGDLQMVLKEIDELSSPHDMPRKIIMIQRALSLVQRQVNPILWSSLQVDLGNSLLNSPQGDRDDNFGQAIKYYGQALEVRTRKDFPEDWAYIQNALAVAYSNCILGNKAENIEEAIKHHNQALDVYTQTDFLGNWAWTQNNLAVAYFKRIKGDRADNIEESIAHHNRALIFYTQKDFPIEWALNQYTLASAYSDRILGDKAENIEQAIVHYNEAFKVRTIKDFPEDWAITLNALAILFMDRIKEDKAENLEKAIEYCNQVLVIRTRKDFPVEWAYTQNTLANIYRNRIKEGKAENIEKAIGYYNKALEIYTKTDFPVEWAMNKNNLAVVYFERILDDKADNIEYAIKYHNQALEVYTRQDFPIDWGMTHHNLANAYKDRILGDEAENIEEAIKHFNQALEVRTQKNLPVEWSWTQHSLANAYFSRIKGDRADNIEEAIVHFNQALAVRTIKDLPVEWASTSHNLATAYRDRMRGDRTENIEQSIEHCNQALKVRTKEGYPVDWAMTQNTLANAYFTRVLGDKADNIEQAIKYYNQVLEVYTLHDFPKDWAMTHHNLANAYFDLIKENRDENLEKAIRYYKKALEVITKKDFPIEWAMIQNNLGNAYSYRIFGDRTENIEEALKHYNHALEVRTQYNIPVEWAGTQHNLANSYRQRIKGDRIENTKKAISYCHGALKVYKLGSMPHDFRRTCNLLGDLYLDMKQWGDAVESYKVAIKAGDLLYRSGLSMGSKNAEVVENADIYRNAAFAVSRLDSASEALLLLDRGKTRLLSEALQLKMKQPEDVPKEEWIKFEQAAGKYRGTTKPSSNKKDYVQREKEIQNTLEELDASLKIVQSYNPLFQKELDVADILSILNADTALVTFCITDSGTIGLMVSRSDGVQSVDIPDFKRKNLKNLLIEPNKHKSVRSGWITGYLNYLDTLGTEYNEVAFQNWQRTLNDVFASISTELLSPVLGKLSDHIKRLIFLPSGDLSLLPLHAVPLSNGQPLCQRYCISYAPSIQLLREMQYKSEIVKGRNLYAVINPQEDPALVFSGCEGQAISKLFKSHQVNVGETGTRATVLDRIPGHAYLHFSCHGSYNWDNPPQSGLHLFGERTLSLADLQSDVVDMSSSRLVTLSACETGITDILKGSADEFVGLPAGFMLAGVPCVVSSLWSVPDISTAMLMERFYCNHIKKEMDIPMALQDAQLWVRELTSRQVKDYVEKCYQSSKWEGKSKGIIEHYRERYLKMAEESPDEKPFQHPYYWAAFTVNGA